MQRTSRIKLLIAFVVVLGAGIFVYFTFLRRPTDIRDLQVMDWLRNSAAHPDWAMPAKTRCGTAPFIMPSSGFIGYLWDDSFYAGHHHQGIDIFGGGQPGETPVYAAYNGYLTRQSDWKSTLIMRVPADPLNPSQQIWLYYTHLAMADGTATIVPDFPPGTREVYVTAGTLLGYQGNYSGTAQPVGVHLHFSIVRDTGDGNFTNELEIANTYDPSPYLGLPLNGPANTAFPVHCNP